MSDETVEIKINKYFWSFLDDIAISRGVTVEEIVDEVITEYITEYVSGGINEW